MRIILFFYLLVSLVSLSTRFAGSNWTKPVQRSTTSVLGNHIYVQYNQSFSDIPFCKAAIQNDHISGTKLTIYIRTTLQCKYWQKNNYISYVLRFCKYSLNYWQWTLVYSKMHTYLLNVKCKMAKPIVVPEFCIAFFFELFFCT